MQCPLRKSCVPYRCDSLMFMRHSLSLRALLACQGETPSNIASPGTLAQSFRQPEGHMNRAHDTKSFAPASSCHDCALPNVCLFAKPDLDLIAGHLALAVKVACCTALQGSHLFSLPCSALQSLQQTSRAVGGQKYCPGIVRFVSQRFACNASLVTNDIETV